MKVLIKNYTFDKTTGQITFTDLATVRKEGILMVVNATDHIRMYVFNNTTLTGTVTTNVLDLAYNTTAMDNTDVLQIFYDLNEDEAAANTEPPTLVTAASLPLPTLAATSTKQSDGSQKTQVVDGSGNVIGATSNALDINIKSGNPTTIAVTQATHDNLNANANLQVGNTDVANGNPVPVSDAGGSLTVDGTVSAAQSGTWTVQPGNTANTVAWKVDGSAVTQPVSGTVTATISAGAATIAKAEDSASANADTGVPMMAVRKATPANTSDTDGDYEMVQMSAGRMWVDASGVTLTVASHAVTNAGTFAVQAAGDVASGSTDSGNPVKQGALAKTAWPTAVTDGQRVNLVASKTGQLVSVGAMREMKGNQLTTITSSTSETTIVTADGTYTLDLYGLIIANTSVTACTVTIKDSTAGTTRTVIRVPAGETRGFMTAVDSGIKQNAANNNWTATCGTSVADIVITAMFAKTL